MILIDLRAYYVQSSEGLDETLSVTQRLMSNHGYGWVLLEVSFFIVHNQTDQALIGISIS